MLKWRIYYDNGETLDNTQSDPAVVVAYGVICIVSCDDMIGRSILHRWDFYYWITDDSRWSGSDLLGVLDRLLHRLSLAGLCQGRSISNKAYREIMSLADCDPDFPRKSGKRTNERA